MKKRITFIGLRHGPTNPLFEARKEDSSLMGVCATRMVPKLRERLLPLCDQRTPDIALVTSAPETQQSATMLFSHVRQVTLKYGHPRVPDFKQHAVEKLKETYEEAVNSFGKPLSWNHLLHCGNTQVTEWWRTQLSEEIGAIFSECQENAVVLFVGLGSLPIVLFDDSDEALQYALHPFNGVVYTLEVDGPMVQVTSRKFIFVD